MNTRFLVSVRRNHPSRVMQRKWCAMIRFLGARWVLSPFYQGAK